MGQTRFFLGVNFFTFGLFWPGGLAGAGVGAGKASGGGLAGVGAGKASGGGLAGVGGGVEEVPSSA
jgi:hypothetical protein